jgi:hypothetical protein
VADSSAIRDDIWGEINIEGWRQTPFLVGRLASEEDVQAGRAVFFAVDPSEHEAKPFGLGLPRCALLRDDEGGLSPVVVIQAEDLREKVLIGYRPLTGGSGICTINELVLLDGPDGHFYPDFADLCLTLEGRPPVLAPTLAQLHVAVDALTSRGGPGFLILERPTKDYAQAAGGDGELIAEWREYSGGTFRHWVAGLPDRPSMKEIHILTNGAHVAVNENERLQAVDVKAVLEAFAHGKGRPLAFAWRDITERFQ